MNPDDLKDFCAQETARHDLARLMTEQSAFPESGRQNFLNQLVPLYHLAAKECARLNVSDQIALSPVRACVNAYQDCRTGIVASFFLYDRTVAQYLEVTHFQLNPLDEAILSPQASRKEIMMAFHGSITTSLNCEKRFHKDTLYRIDPETYRNVPPIQALRVIQNFLCGHRLRTFDYGD